MIDHGDIVATLGAMLEQEKNYCRRQDDDNDCWLSTNHNEMYRQTMTQWQYSKYILICAFFSLLLMLLLSQT